MRRYIVTGLLCLLVCSSGVAVCAEKKSDITSTETARPERVVPESIAITVVAELYEPVVFDHSLHLDMYGCARCHHHTAGEPADAGYCGRCHQQPVALDDMRCIACHHRTAIRDGASPRLPVDGGDARDTRRADEERVGYHNDVPGFKGAMHLLCRNCHLDEGGPVVCVDCHGFSAAGRQRFHLAVADRAVQQSKPNLSKEE